MHQLQNKAPLDSDQAGPLGEGGPNESGSAGKELSQGYRKLMEIIEANQTRAEKILMKVPMMEITGYKTGILCSTARGSKVNIGDCSLFQAKNAERKKPFSAPQQPVTVFNDIKVYKSTISDGGYYFSIFRRNVHDSISSHNPHFYFFLEYT